MVHITNVVFVAILFHLCCAKKIEMELQRIEQLEGNGFLTSQLRVTKYNRTTPVVTGTISYFEDMDNSYTFEMQCAYSPLGNNQFNEYPMNLKKQNFCDFINTTYREYQHIWKKGSDWIQVGPKGLCPWPKGVYTFENFWVSDTSFIPPVVPPGLWRVRVVHTGPKKQRSVIQLFTKVWYS
ncbi:uncharacterized protein LOC129751150 [Uranotaenia lowii]|uniref:uncharacterized protein LOC129751150 n=1 Tax=Uranotaenia lowii TaxID=190385 RepID=UPI00247A90F2|nr:uncharacterized protein LOC129751150 [Uranotaenia lowii]